MKDVLGGLIDPGLPGGPVGGGGSDDCIKSECASNSDCSTAYPHCYKETCNSTGKEVTYCGINP